jgi:hypothetical protein
MENSVSARRENDDRLMADLKLPTVSERKTGELALENKKVCQEGKRENKENEGKKCRIPLNYKEAVQIPSNIVS